MARNPFDEYDPPLYEDGTSVNLDDYATEQYVNEKVVAAAAVCKPRRTGPTRFTALAFGFCKPEVHLSPSLQRFILTNEAFEDTAEFAEAKYISVHALGGGDFINYQFEKVGDTIQIYGNPLTGDQKASFGIYEIEEITEHNFPDDPNADGADFSDAFVAYTVKPLASQGIVEPNEMCQIKTMPPVGAVGGGAETHVGENPPADAKVGDLWYCTKLDDLTLYVLAEKVEDGEDVWAAAAPPVSLDGVREDMQNIDNTLSEVRSHALCGRQRRQRSASSTAMRQRSPNTGTTPWSLTVVNGAFRVQTRRSSRSTPITAPAVCSTCKRLPLTTTQSAVATSKKTLS